ncbi:hypothetical protein C1645_731320 [Glomus cerebriforme]|uniref:Uncharacterized protein n=1 Tax=Glomus cerebriforme TaxID=658196 RepID=A0A397TLP0_9GLOM|nr:hypothetical protein C1645_731320 [Glomus cerebriforme]
MNTNNQQHESNTAPQIHSSNNISQPQGNVAIAEYPFFYMAQNDYQIYHINCEEIPFDLLLTNVTQNPVQPSHLHIFYYQQPDDRRIYKITCEVVSYTFIVRMLNNIHYGVELNLNGQQQEVFSRAHKENLEFHLKNDLTYYLAPIDTSQQPIIDNNVINQSY